MANGNDMDAGTGLVPRLQSSLGSDPTAFSDSVKGTIACT